MHAYTAMSIIIEGICGGTTLCKGAYDVEMSLLERYVLFLCVYIGPGPGS